jgi:hypothetical protein
MSVGLRNLSCAAVGRPAGVTFWKLIKLCRHYIPIRAYAVTPSLIIILLLKVKRRMHFIHYRQRNQERGISLLLIFKLRNTSVYSLWHSAHNEDRVGSLSVETVTKYLWSRSHFCSAEECVCEWAKKCLGQGCVTPKWTRARSQEDLINFFYFV